MNYEFHGYIVNMARVLWNRDPILMGKPIIKGASLVDQYPSRLVHIVGFKIVKNRTNILQVLGGMRGLRWAWVGWFIRIEV